MGPKNVTLLGAGRLSPVTLFSFQELLVPLCASGYYGLEGQYCTPCPVGVLCPGGELKTPLISALAGFWLNDASLIPSSIVCPIGPLCAYAVACAPSESCLANNVCATGYVGTRCALCDNGFYRVNSACAPCPSSPYAVIIGFVLGALAALGVSYGLNKSGISLTLISIGIDYAQV